jgi:hypothetical protein
VKKLLLLLLFIPLVSFGQESFDSFNESDGEPKVIYKSYTDLEETYFIAFFDDGTIVHQSNEYNYIEDRRVNNTFSSAQEFVQLLSDMKEVSKKKKTIIKDKYAIEKNNFGSVKLKIKGIKKTFYFTKYAMKLFQKSLDKSL